jgi:hypothetical protein
VFASAGQTPLPTKMSRNSTSHGNQGNLHEQKEKRDESARRAQVQT